MMKTNMHIHTYGSSAPYHYTEPTCGPIFFLLDRAVRVIDGPNIGCVGRCSMTFV